MQVRSGRIYRSNSQPVSIYGIVTNSTLLFKDVACLRQIVIAQEGQSPGGGNALCPDKLNSPIGLPLFLGEEVLLVEIGGVLGKRAIGKKDQAGEQNQGHGDIEAVSDANPPDKGHKQKENQNQTRHDEYRQDGLFAGKKL